MKKYVGFYKAIVSKTNDPEKRGRIKCIIPEVLGGDMESAWCDPCVPVAYDNGGDFCLPKKKETVWIAFEKGDPNYPVYLGGWWKRNETPLEDYSDKENTRVISYSNCVIKLKDNTINISVGGGETDLQIQNNKITINGSLKVKGNINCEKIYAENIS